MVAGRVAGDWRGLVPPAHVHLMGIGGTGMSGLARMLRTLGYVVTGCDRAHSPECDRLQAEGIRVFLGHDAAHVQEASMVVLSAAVPTDEPEIQAALAQRIPVVKRAAVLGWLSQQRRCLAVAGTHGKSTTSGMLAWILHQAACQPSFAVGAEIRDLGVNAQLGPGDSFVVEADEYDYSFLLLRPAVAVVLNIEHDHPDLFPTPAHVERAFLRFLEGIQPNGAVVISADDPGAQRVRACCARRDVQFVTFGQSSHAAWRVDPNAPAWLYGPDGTRWPLDLPIPGWHNRLNAAAAVAAAQIVGVPPAESVRALATFHGVGRRFEYWGDARGVTVVIDYAHHPSEIAATIAAARAQFPQRRLWVVFQPHTYSRTVAFLDRFAQSLEAADEVVLLPIYAAREVDPGTVRSIDIANRIRRVAPLLANTVAEAVTMLKHRLQEGDVVLILGAGDVWRAAPALIRALEAGT